MPAVIGPLARRKHGRASEIALAMTALALAALGVIAIGATTNVTRVYWVEAAVWAAGVIVALGVGAVAVARVLDQREHARALARLQASVGHALAEAGTLAETTEAMLRALGEALDLSLAVAWRSDAADERLRLAGLWAAPHIDVDAFRADSEHVEFERGQGVLGSVWARGSPRAARIAHGGFRRQELLDSLGFEGAVFVPIRQHGGVSGVVECFTDDVTHVDQALLDVIAQIGSQIGVAYDRATRIHEFEQAEERRRYVLGALLRAEEDAKAQLASDLHDDTIQVMVAAQLAMERLERAMAGGDIVRTEHAVVAARQTLQAATERARHLMFQLRPQVLTEQGLGAAARALLDDAAADSGFEYELTAHVARYPRSLENLCYRVLQEAIANVRKHARARTVTVELRQHGDDIRCRVSDDGVGFDLAGALDRDRMRLHLGLESMRERVSVAGGTLDIRSAPGEGATFTFTFPLSAAADEEPAEQASREPAAGTPISG
jgi:signal transduction histidine kinase